MDAGLVVDEIEAAVHALRGVWDGEPVDEWEHAMQCAGHAARHRPADQEFVAAALLHDIARSPVIAAVSGLPHEQVARLWLTPRLGARVGWLAGAHVAAKRVLAADPDYAGALSPTSVDSLRGQGGPSVEPGWTVHPWWPDALLLRRCDDAAKVPGASTPDWSPLRGLLRDVAGARAGAGR